VRTPSIAGNTACGGGKSSPTRFQRVDETLGISESKFKFRRARDRNILFSVGLKKRPSRKDFQVLAGALMLSRYCAEKILARLWRVAFARNLRRHAGRRRELPSKIFASKFF
jgi:hypothetical protein